MSHLTTIRTEIRDSEILLETIKELKIPITQGKSIRQAGSSEKRIDLVISGKGGLQLGLKKNSPDDPYEIIGRWETLENKETKNLIDKIYQEYARRKVITEAQKKGFSLVMQQRTETGDIRLVLKKLAVGAL